MATVIYLSKSGLKFATTDEFLRKALSNYSIPNYFLPDCPNAMKASFTKG